MVFKIAVASIAGQPQSDSWLEEHKMCEKLDYLTGCVSEDEKEIDGQEFETNSLEEFIALLKQNKELHLNFFGDENIDLWVKIE